MSMHALKRVVESAVFLCFLVLSVFPVSGQEKKTISAGLLVEANANTRHGYGLAGGVTAEYGITDNFALGIRGDYGTDFYEVSSVEALAFGRYYFLNTPLTFPLFLQAGAGLSMLFEEDRSVSTVLGEGGIGIRFPIKKFYTEQYLRFGWPFGFGFGMVVGYRFDLKSSQPDIRERQRESETTIPDPLLPEPGSHELLEKPGYNELLKEPESAQDPNPRKEPEPVEEPEPPELESLRSMEIIFISNMADFESMGNAHLKTFEDNIHVLSAIADFLKDRQDYTLTITGHANPVEKTAKEEEESLRPLSLKRAEYVKARLVKLGVDSERLSTVGAGGQETDPKTPARNRRVNFSFEKKVPAAPGN
jgi:outer membrane protein OmpA-like peptidoglycan-associated protein